MVVAHASLGCEAVVRLTLVRGLYAARCARAAVPRQRTPGETTWEFGWLGKQTGVPHPGVTHTRSVRRPWSDALRDSRGTARQVSLWPPNSCPARSSAVCSWWPPTALGRLDYRRRQLDRV